MKSPRELLNDVEVGSAKHDVAVVRIGACHEHEIDVALRHEVSAKCRRLPKWQILVLIDAVEIGGFKAADQASDHIAFRLFVAFLHFGNKIQLMICNNFLINKVV